MISDERREPIHPGIAALFPKTRAISALLGAAAAAGGAITLSGWFTNAPRLTDWLNTGISMMPNAALCCMSGGVALLLLAGNRLRAVAGLLGCLIAALAAATLLQTISGISLGIDQLVLARDWGQRGTVAPGRMGPPASLSWILLGVSLAAISFPTRMRSMASACSILTLAIAMLSLIGYILRAEVLFTIPRLTAIALQTAVMIALVGVGIIMATPDREPMKMLLADSTAGVLARRAFPLLILVPIVLALLRVFGQEVGLFDTSFGTAMRTVLEIILLVGLLWWALSKVATKETALRASEAQKAAVLDSSIDAIVTIDAGGRVVEFNPAAESMFGIPYAKAIGRMLAELIIPERFRAAHTRGMAHHMAIGQEPILARRIEMAALRADGTEFPVELSINRVPGIDPPRFSGFIRDITVRKAAENARSRLAAIVEFSEDAIISKDLNSVITSWNAAAERLFGYTAEEAIGQPIMILSPPERLDEEPTILGRIRSGEGVDHFETLRRRKDGTSFDVALTISPIRNATGQIVGASHIARDITERKRSEQALREANELIANRAQELEAIVERRTADLRETVHQLEAFSYSIVHDMRAPLRTMRSFATLLVDDYRDKVIDETGRDYLHRIMNAAGRMDTLITDVLNYSRMAHGETTLSDVDLDALVTEIVAQYPQFKERAHCIRIEHPLPKVCGNTALLTQVFSNLLDNALKFVPHGQEPTVAVRAETENGVVRIWVEDRGIGIPVELQGKLFGLFERLHGPKDYAGTGVGLAIVKRAVERMGGKVGVESDAGKGSRFWVELKECGAA